MATPQELYDETKTRLDLNIAKAQMLQKEIDQKVQEKKSINATNNERSRCIKTVRKT